MFAGKELQPRESGLTNCKSAAGPHAGARTNLRSLARSRRVPPERASVRFGLSAAFARYGATPRGTYG